MRSKVLMMTVSALALQVGILNTANAFWDWKTKKNPELNLIQMKKISCSVDSKSTRKNHVLLETTDGGQSYRLQLTDRSKGNSRVENHVFRNLKCSSAPGRSQDVVCTAGKSDKALYITVYNHYVKKTDGQEIYDHQVYFQVDRWAFDTGHGSLLSIDLHQQKAMGSTCKLERM